MHWISIRFYEMGDIIFWIKLNFQLDLAPPIWKTIPQFNTRKTANLNPVFIWFFQNIPPSTSPANPPARPQFDRIHKM